MIARLRYCLTMIDPFSPPECPRFIEMYNQVHVDEKWFNLTQTSSKYYLSSIEEDPIRTTKSKRFITKVMFLAAVSQPCWDTSRNQWWNGKIGIFPFTYQEPAKRNSKNRVKGTMETKAMNVDKNAYRKMLIEKVIPAIVQKLPQSLKHRPIWIQQDNATPHISPHDSDFAQEATKNGFDIRLKYQPPNSPDTNVLDLGFFNAIQSLQYQESPKTIDELIVAVNNAFENQTRLNLSKIFLTHQQCMIDIMKTKGGNGYKIPHMGKDRLERAGKLPTCLSVDQDLIKSVKDILNNQQEGTVTAIEQ